LRGFQIAESISKYHVTTKRTKDTKDSEINYISISSFVLFATFVVKFLFPILVAASPRWVDVVGNHVNVVVVPEPLAQRFNKRRFA